MCKREFTKIDMQKDIEGLVIEINLRLKGYSLLHINHFPYQSWPILIEIIDPSTFTDKSMTIVMLMRDFNTSHAKDCLYKTF